MEARVGVGEKKPPLSNSNSKLQLLRAFARDSEPVAKALEEFLQNPSKEAAEKLLADLPDLLPADPATAAVIADAMAEAMAEEVGEEGTDGTKGTKETSRASLPSRESQKSQDEITQEQAEELYEEMMSK